MDAPVLVQLDGGDDNFAGMDANGNRCTIRLVPLYAIDVDDPLLAVHLRNLPFATLVFPSHNPHFIVLTNR